MKINLEITADYRLFRSHIWTPVKQANQLRAVKQLIVERGYGQLMYKVAGDTAVYTYICGRWHSGDILQ